MARRLSTFLGVPVQQVKPTRTHRPAVWETLLGAVNAMDDNGKVRYFDLDHAAALAYAGVSTDRDPRLWRADGRTNYAKEGESPRAGRLVLWVKKN